SCTAPTAPHYRRSHPAGSSRPRTPNRPAPNRPAVTVTAATATSTPATGPRPNASTTRCTKPPDDASNRSSPNPHPTEPPDQQPPGVAVRSAPRSQYPGPSLFPWSLPVFLKSLTIKGFKSSADSTVLEMEPGVTVVVGPN